MSINKELIKLAEQQKALRLKQKELLKKLSQEERNRKMKFHPFIDESLFVKISNLEGTTVPVEIRNDENILEDVEVIVTKKALVKAVHRTIDTAFSDFEFLQVDFE